VVGRNNLRRHSSAQLGLIELVELFFRSSFSFVFNLRSLRVLWGRTIFTFKSAYQVTHRKPKTQFSHSKSSKYYLSSLLIVLLTQVPFVHLYLLTVFLQHSISLIRATAVVRVEEESNESVELGEQEEVEGYVDIVTGQEFYFADDDDLIATEVETAEQE
jgi:hypothetical protein